MTNLYGDWGPDWDPKDWIKKNGDYVYVGPTNGNKTGGESWGIIIILILAILALSR